MDANLSGLLEEIRDLEKSVNEQLKKKESDFVYKIKNRTVTFNNEVIAAHIGLRKSIYRFLTETTMLSYLVAPVVYSLIIPAVMMDIFINIYQNVCFRVYGIPLVKRHEYVSLDRHKLKYLNWIERMNCDYCGYFNGVVGYTREVASRTEQYFCPVRHALRTKGLHARHAQFLAYGDTHTFRARFTQLRNEVRETKVIV